MFLCCWRMRWWYVRSGTRRRKRCLCSADDLLIPRHRSTPCTLTLRLVSHWAWLLTKYDCTPCCSAALSETACGRMNLVGLVIQKQTEKEESTVESLHWRLILLIIIEKSGSLSRMPSHFQLQPGSSDHKTGECDEFTHISETNGMHWWCHILKQGALYQAWENYFLLLLFLHFILFFSYECLSVFTPLRRTRNVYIEVLIWKQPDWLIGFQGVLRQKQRWTWKCSRSGRRMNSNCVTEFGWRLALKVNILVQEWTHWTMSNGNQD